MAEKNAGTELPLGTVVTAENGASSAESAEKSIEQLALDTSTSETQKDSRNVGRAVPTPNLDSKEIIANVPRDLSEKLEASVGQPRAKIHTSGGLSDDELESIPYDDKRTDIKRAVDEQANKIKQRQKQLADQIVRDRLASEERATLKADTATNAGIPLREISAYSDASKFPLGVQRNKIHVDPKAEAILLPIYGSLVPFHISVVKSVRKMDDLLRINFIAPTKVVQPQANSERVLCITETTFRIRNARDLNNTLMRIQQLRKEVNERETIQRNKVGLVPQVPLQINRIPAKLSGVFMRPNVTAKRVMGTLEAHKNGFRFVCKGLQVDILFANIKYAFFIPCESEQVALIHFHLRDFIVAGKKKLKDIQFYAEVVEMSQDTSRASARDEIEEERAEAQRRIKRNKEFEMFVHKVEELGGLEFDITFRDLGFYGVPSRNNVFLQPTVHCLISIIETPFFILSLKEVEICVMERISFGLRNFDMVFVLKDYSQSAVKIASVPVTSLDHIRDWLNECNIKFYENPSSLNWPRVLETVRKDVAGFFKDGGWGTFLDDNVSDAPSEPSDSESDFSPSGSDSESESDDEDEDDEYEDSDSDGSSFDGSESSSVSEEENGMDWDELERKAAAEDRGDDLKRKRNDAGEEPNPKKLKKTSPPTKPIQKIHKNSQPSTKSITNRPPTKSIPAKPVAKIPKNSQLTTKPTNGPIPKTQTIPQPATKPIIGLQKIQKTSQPTVKSTKPGLSAPTPQTIPRPTTPTTKTTPKTQVSALPTTTTTKTIPKTQVRPLPTTATTKTTPKTQAQPTATMETIPKAQVSPQPTTATTKTTPKTQVPTAMAKILPKTAKNLQPTAANIQKISTAAAPTTKNS